MAGQPGQVGLGEVERAALGLERGRDPPRLVEHVRHGLDRRQASVAAAHERQSAHVHAGVHHDLACGAVAAHEVRRQPDGDGRERGERSERGAHLGPPLLLASRGVRSRRARQHATVVGGEVAGPCSHLHVAHAGQPHLDAAEAAVALRVRGLVREQVVGLRVLRDRLQPRPQVVRVLDHEAAGVDRDGVHRGAHPLLAAPGHDLDDSGGCRPDHIQALGAQRRRQSDQASGVERIDDHAGPRGRVGDASHVEAQATSRGEAGNEAIRNEEERLAARDSRQAAAHALEHLQREPRVVDGFSEHDPRPAPRLPLGRPCVLEDADRHDLLDRRGEGHRVPRLDHLRLVLGDVDIPPVGAPALRRQPRQRLAQDRAVGGELLRERRRAARRHERHLVLRPQVLVEEALEGLAHADEALELHVDVVDREHDVARGQLRLAFRRHAPGGDGRRRRRARPPRSAARTPGTARSSAACRPRTRRNPRGAGRFAAARAFP